MKILFLINSFGRGGAEQSMKELALGLKISGHDVAYFALFPCESEIELDQCIEYGITVGVLSKTPNFFEIIVALWKLVSKGDYDLVCSAMLKSNLYAEIIARVRCIDHYASIRNNPAVYYNKNIIKKLVVSVAMSLNKKVFFISEKAYSDTANDKFFLWLKNRKKLIIQNGVAVDCWLAKGAQSRLRSKINNIKIWLLGPQKTKLRICVVSRLVPGKGHVGILSKLQHFIENNNVKIDFFGAGELEYHINQFILKHAMQEKVRCLGFKKDVLNEIKNYDVMFFPSESEGFGRVQFEAVAIGVPVFVNESSFTISELGGRSDMALPYKLDTLDIIDCLNKLSNLDLVAADKFIDRVQTQISSEYFTNRFVENVIDS